MKRLIRINEFDLHRIVRNCINEMVQQTQVPQQLQQYGTIRNEITDISRLPRDMAYRETDVNELEDILECGYMRQMPDNKTVQGAKREFTSKSGRKFSFGKVNGNSHGGKGFAKGAPWTTMGGTTSIGSATKVIIGVPGNILNWQVGFHGHYSKEQPFNSIEHGKPLFLPFGENGNINGFSVNNIRVWISDTEGYYHEFIPNRR